MVRRALRVRGGVTVAAVVAATALVALTGPIEVAAAAGRAGLAMRLASVDVDGVEGNGISGFDAPSLSADGRYVAFRSGATNLVSADVNGVIDAFVKDRFTGQVERVTVNSAGVAANGQTLDVSISADGRFVAFASLATNLASGDNNAVSDVFLRDRVRATTTRVSVNVAGAGGNGASVAPSVSADGRFVAFESAASNLAPGDVNGQRDVFFKAMANGYVEAVSVVNAGTWGNNASRAAVISAGGRFVAFSSVATNLVPVDANGVRDVFVRDLGTRTTERVSVNSAGLESNGPSSDGDQPAISGDGKYLAFSSTASNLVAGDTNARRDIFIRDRGAGTTTRASVDSSGTQANDHSANPVMSIDGRSVAFDSVATNLVPADASSRRSVFVRDQAGGATELVDVRADGEQADHPSQRPGISGDGGTIAFSSEALNLNPVTARPQVYVQGTGTGPHPNCDFGESSIVCELLYAEGVGPVTIRWYVNGVHAPNVDDQPVAVHPCVPGDTVEIRVLVSDRNGPIDARTSLPCLTDTPSPSPSPA